MKCPFRIYDCKTTSDLYTGSSSNIKTQLIEESSQEFKDCLGNECMAYRKHRRTEMCQKFPMGYYKDILD